MLSEFLHHADYIYSCIAKNMFAYLAVNLCMCIIIPLIYRFCMKSMLKYLIKRDGFDINLPQIKQYTEEEMYRSVYRYSPVHILKDCIKHNRK